MSALKQQKIDVLRLVRKRILEGARDDPSNGGNLYICNQLGLLQDFDDRYLAIADLRMYVRAAIEPHATLDSWSAEARGEAGQLPPTPQAVRLRIRWIDWMIQCLQEDIAQGK